MSYDNLGAYITRVRRWLHETDPTKSFWDDQFLKDLFNAAYRRRAAQLTMAYEGAFVERATRDIVKDQDRYDWPNGFERLIKLELVHTSGRTIPIQRFERHEEINYITTATGDMYNPTYRPIGGGFILEPTPRETITGGLRIEYISTPPVLTADSDELHKDFPRSFSELLVLDTAVNALDSENLLESGVTKTILRQRTELEIDFMRYIDNRLVSKQRIQPFVPHYENA